MSLQKIKFCYLPRSSKIYDHQLNSSIVQLCLEMAFIVNFSDTHGALALFQLFYKFCRKRFLCVVFTLLLQWNLK